MVMNYIKLLIAAQQKIIEDDRLNATHVSLYFSLFQIWNSCHFAKTFFINRQELMNASKIGSKGTYLKCLKDLDAWGYMDYFPSNNSYKGSTIRMQTFSTTDEVESQDENPIPEESPKELSDRQINAGTNSVPAEIRQETSNEPPSNQNCTSSGPRVNRQGTSTEQAPVPFINNNKQTNNKKLPNDRQSVLDFFDKNNFGKEEGLKFFEFYESNLWKTGDGSVIRDWQAVALSWMERTFKKTGRKTSQFKDHLKTRKEKNYEQPL